MRLAARRAGRVAPAVAVAAALATGSHPTILGPTAAAIAGLADPAQLSHPGQVASPSIGHLAAATGGARRPQRTGATGPGRTATHANTWPAGSRSTAASPGRSSGHPKRAVGATAHRTPACSGTSGMLPANYAAIVGFLTAHGYAGNAAAGIAGNIYQESKGNPESAGSGGGGLIGWTPLPAGFVTGNPSADLDTQLAAILSYNQQWSAYLPALNAATSAAAAADIYMNDFEHPGIAAASNRETAATAVAMACGI